MKPGSRAGHTGVPIMVPAVKQGPPLASDRRSDRTARTSRLAL